MGATSFFLFLWRKGDQLSDDCDGIGRAWLALGTNIEGVMTQRLNSAG